MHAWVLRLAGAARLGLLGLFGLLAVGAALAQGLQPIPPLSARVIDTTGTLGSAERARLEAQLQAFEQAQGTQIVVLMVPTTRPEDIVGYTQRVGDLWKIGRKDVGDGLLLVAALNDRTLRIAPAKALEGAVPDLAARRVIDEALTPAFVRGDFAGGLEAGLAQLMGLIRGEGLPAPAPRSVSAAPDWTGLLVFLFVAVPVVARVLSALAGRKLGALITGGGIGALAWWVGAGLALSLLAALVGSVFALASGLAPMRGVRPSSWGGGSWGGGGHWGGGAGGFRSGGGGNFGGGGASGRW